MTQDNKLSQARIMLHLDKKKNERLQNQRKEEEKRIPIFEENESVLDYYKNRIYEIELMNEAEKLLDKAIIEQVWEWATNIKKTLWSFWDWLREYIEAILRDRWCEDIKIEYRDVSEYEWNPKSLNDIKFSVKNILEELQ